MLFLVQGIIFLKYSIPLFPSVSALGEILLHASHDVVYASRTQEMVVYKPISQSFTTMFLIWIEVRP